MDAIQATGRDAILRGSGKSNSKSKELHLQVQSNVNVIAGAAVCILESHASHIENKVRGLVRMVEVAPNMTIVDLSIRGLTPGTYHATVRESGDISQGPESVGGIWEAVQAEKQGKPSRGVFGEVKVGKDGVGAVFLDRPIYIWEMIGRSIVVARHQDGKACRYSLHRRSVLTCCSLTETMRIHWSASLREVQVFGIVSSYISLRSLT